MQRADSGNTCEARGTKVECGMVTAEWAITAPVFIFAVIVCIAAIIHTSTNAEVSSAAREAARIYAINKDEVESESVARDIAGKSTVVSIRVDGDLAEVTVTQPEAALFSFFGYEFTNTQYVVLEP